MPDYGPQSALKPTWRNGADWTCGLCYTPVSGNRGIIEKQLTAKTECESEIQMATGIVASPEYSGPVTSINTTRCTCTILDILPCQRWSKEHQGTNQQHVWLKPEGTEWPTGQRELKIWAQFPQKTDTQYALSGHLTATTSQTHDRFQWPPVCELWKNGLACK